jgi:hypothetical protein
MGRLQQMGDTQTGGSIAGERPNNTAKPQFFKPQIYLQYFTIFYNEMQPWACATAVTTAALAS